MNSKILIRLTIYSLMSLTAFGLSELSDLPELQAVTAKQWVTMALGALAAVLIPIRAFIDQTVSRENGVDKPTEPTK